MNALVNAAVTTAEAAATPLESAPTTREERNRQRREWRNSAVNPRNKGRGDPTMARYDHG